MHHLSQNLSTDKVLLEWYCWLEFREHGPISVICQGKGDDITEPKNGGAACEENVTESKSGEASGEANVNEMRHTEEVVFAAAFTVPGGNNTVGIPLFLQQPSFLVFAVSDALALFSSTASLLMFLGILTSRYAEEDFLNSLPKKLIIGLITLFLSIASMMVAFGATIYLFLSHPWKWVIIPISLLGCVPVTLFAMLQFPLLVDMFLSTYGPSILKPRKVRM
ncbi:hypothetical protein Pint_29111 [Pistacia integerrima]|uniref:Uncharacterized protein n=1 Tax=Pistacia integerrima TaxID=434235 RepID=A0ACC0X3S9_9ROSI|nr:hypothetical protein Pint_29111 [Pistacia integerrima]